MEEAPFEGEVATGSTESIDSHAKMTKPPDKKKHEITIAELMAQIEVKQTELRALGPNSSDMTSEQVRSRRAEKEAAFRKRREIESQIAALTQEIRKKNNELTKVQSNLQGYRSEPRIDDAIRKFENQLKMNNFKLSDEKKMVAEIDSLKRSKKVLCVVNSLKKEIGGMKDRQRQLREDRDCYFKKVNEIKQLEEAHKRKAQTDKLRHEEVKKEIDTLYEEKRAVISQFKSQEKEFHKYRESVRFKQKQDEFLKKEEKRLAYQQELAEYEASRDPYQDEKQLCNTLLAYLLNNLPINSPETSQDMEEGERASSGHDSDTLAQSFESEGLYLLKKKQEDLFIGITKPKTHRKSKKDKKRVMSNKKINHSPQTLQQFAELRIKAPTTVMDVHETIQQVESKKLHFECLPPPQLIIPQPRQFVDGLPSDEKSSAGTPSVTESAIAESIPSTPEVQGDAAVNPFLREGANGSSPWRHQRKLSHDSGAYELEDEEQRTPDCDGQFLQNPLLQPMETSAATTSDKMAAGDFPWKSELSRRTLSTVSSLSDKDSSASSDTIVDSPQNKSGDDLKITSPFDSLHLHTDSLEGAASRDYTLGPDWPVLSRENSNSSQKSPKKKKVPTATLR